MKTKKQKDTEFEMATTMICIALTIASIIYLMITK